MAKKTWFLPPDFTFLPDGQLAIGNIIPDPRRPTVTLASLSNHAITVPAIISMPEKRHAHTPNNSRSFGFKLFTKFLGIAGSDIEADISRSKSRSYSAMEQEIRKYNGSFTPEALRAIVALEPVKKHIESGRFGKRCVYIITGLRIAKDSFTVTDEEERKTQISLGGSAADPTGTVPAEFEGKIHGNRETGSTGGFDTAPGVIFAYRLDVIRPKDADAEAELFSDRTGFCSGELDDDGEEEEMELLGVDGAALRQDLDLAVNTWAEETIDEEDEESFVVFARSPSMHTSRP